MLYYKFKGRVVDADVKTLCLCKTNFTPVPLCANNKKDGRIFN
jgi:hypothetical protein